MILRKTRQGNTTQQKDKVIQHNLPKAVIFTEKLATSSEIQTHDIRILGNRHFYQLSNRGSSAGWHTHKSRRSIQSTSTKASQPDKQANTNLACTIQDNVRRIEYKTRPSFPRAHWCPVLLTIPVCVFRNMYMYVPKKEFF